MWRNYLTVAMRALAKNKTYAFINIFGLAIGIAACLAIVLFIRYETSFDSWIPDAGRTFQFQRVMVGGEDSGKRAQMMPYVASTTLAGQIPEIEAATSMINGNEYYRVGGRPLALEHSYEAGANFFDVLNLPLVHGDPATALARAGDTILTESAAMTLFGHTDVVGRTVTRILPTGDQDSRVTGVLKDIPRNSHLKIDTLYRTDPGAPGSTNPEGAGTGWWWSTGWVYARLRPGADAAAVNARIPTILRRFVSPEPGETGLIFNFELVNLLDINTLPTDSGMMQPVTPMRVIVTFAIVALFLLLVACVNFTNLTTARASRRAREVGLRKALGARRRQLIFQFLGESIVLAGLATLLGMAVLELVLPSLSAFLDAELSLRYFGSGGIAVPALLFVLLVGAVGGLYPAFYLSRFQPVDVLKVNQSVGPGGAGRLRNFLVIGQFAVSIALIICTAIIYSQTDYARSTDPGYRASGMVLVMRPSHIGDRLQVDTFLREARKIPGVTAAARTSVFPNPTSGSIEMVRRPGATQNTRLQMALVDGEAFRTLGLKLLGGRLVTESRETDMGPDPSEPGTEPDRRIRERGYNVVIDQNAVRALGFPSLRAALGQTVAPLNRGEEGPYTIVGVVNDARYGSMRFEAMPFLYALAPTGHSALAVRFENTDGARVRAALQRLWESRVTDGIFEASFADERVEDMYADDEKRGIMFALFAVLAILISCLGLFGLAAFTAERRTREIGIRKVLGARTRDIVRLLVWQFSWPVLIANLIAWPVAWWAMRDWLNGFADRIALGPAPFLLAGLLAFAIAIGTIAGHAIKVARANPIHALRYE